MFQHTVSVLILEKMLRIQMTDKAFPTVLLASFSPSQALPLNNQSLMMSQNSRRQRASHKKDRTPPYKIPALSPPHGLINTFEVLKLPFMK